MHVLGEIVGRKKLYTEDLTGKVFGERTVLHLDKEKSIPGKSRFWVCRCSCGHEGSVNGFFLLQGKSTMCGVCALKKVKNKVHTLFQ